MTLNATAAAVDLLWRIVSRPVQGGWVLRHDLSSPANCLEIQSVRGESEIVPERVWLRKSRRFFDQLGGLLLNISGGELVFGTEIAEELIALGEDLWLRLVPWNIRRCLSDFSDLIGSILIETNEPWIPWELVIPDSARPRPFLCCHYRLARWHSQETGPRLQFGIRRILGVTAASIEGHADLPFARKEKDWLDQWIQQPGLDGEVLDRPTRSEVTNLIQEGRFDLFHFAGHALHELEDSDDSRLVLADLSLRPRHLTENLLRNVSQTRPLIVLNACHTGRQGHALTGLGGWPDRWIQRGNCGALICPQWQVRDSVAERFSRLVYEKWRDGATLGGAVLKTRCELYDDNPADPTPLAYSLYGHPNALVRFGDSAVSRYRKNRTPTAPQYLNTWGKRQGAESRSPLRGAPRSLSVDFVGRAEELKQLQRLLSQASRMRVAASVEGLAGIGKTELALQLVHLLARGSLFVGGIYWFDAEDSDLTMTWGSDFADALGVREGPVADRAAEAVRLVSAQSLDVLLVLDNLGQWDSSVQPGPLPEGAHIHYLVTTRHRRLGGTQFNRLELGFLSPPYDRQLVCSVAGREWGDDSGISELLSYLGGHALALELAGAFLAEFPEETPASYWAAIRAGDDIAAEVASQVRYEGTVRQTFEALWQRLDEGTQAAWRLAACFESEPVLPALSDAVGVNYRARRSLRRLHLVETDSIGTWRMHRLTREFGRTAGTDEEMQAAWEAYVKGCKEYCTQIELSTGFQVYLPSRTHLDAAVAVAEEVLGEDDQRVSSLLDSVGTAVKSAGDYARARDLQTKALALDIRRLGEDHPDIATKRSNLATSLRRLGDLEGAQHLLVKALASDLRSFGEEHPNVAISRSNLGLVLQALGDFKGALELLGKALSSDLHSFGEGHPSVATRRSNLATVLWDLGSFEGSRKLLEKALESNIHTFGEDHPKVSRCRSNLAMAMQALGDLEGAHGLMEKALASDLSSFGEDHPKVATRRSNLALVLRAQKNLEGAREQLEQALESSLRSFGEDHLSVAKCRSNLATVLQDLGDVEAARELFEKALASNFRGLGEDHPEVAASLSRLALVLHALGDLEAAKERARRALKICERLPEGSYARVGVERRVQSILGESEE